MKQLDNMKKFTHGRLCIRLNGPVKDGGKVLSYDMTDFSEEDMDVLGNAVKDIDENIDDNIFYAWITKGYIDDGDD